MVSADLVRFGSVGPASFSGELVLFCFLKLLEQQGLEAVIGPDEPTDRDQPPPSAPEEKRPSLSLEELEAKQGNCFLHSSQ